MGIFGLFGPPNIDKLRAQKNIKGLTKALRDSNPDIRIKAAEALCEAGDDSVVEPLITLLRDDNKEVRHKSAEVLQSIGWVPRNEAEQVTLLIAMSRWDEILESGEDSVRGLIAILEEQKVCETNYFLYPLAALWEIGEPAVPLLIDRLRNGVPPIRAVASLALGVIGDSRAIEPLVATLRDSNEDLDLRMSMGLALQCMGEDALEPLIAILRSSEADIHAKVSATTNLGAIGDSAMRPLIDALQDVDDYNRFFVLCSLIGTGHPRAMESIQSMLGEKETTTRDIAVLLSFFDPLSLDRLLAMIKHPEDLNRKLAAIALGNTYDCAAAEALIRAFKSDSNASVQSCAMFSLCKLSECPEVRDTLLEMFRKGSEEQRLYVAVALKLSGISVLWRLD